MKYNLYIVCNLCIYLCRSDYFKVTLRKDDILSIHISVSINLFFVNLVHFYIFSGAFFGLLPIFVKEHDMFSPDVKVFITRGSNNNAVTDSIFNSPTGQERSVAATGQEQVCIKLCQLF